MVTTPGLMIRRWLLHGGNAGVIEIKHAIFRQGKQVERQDDMGRPDRDFSPIGVETIFCVLGVSIGFHDGIPGCRRGFGDDRDAVVRMLLNTGVL